MAANYCGTGLDEYVPPGDPTLGSPILSARSVWPGIEVSWTYPNINPEGVAHTLLYRSRSNNFSSAIQLAIVEGGYYFDQDPTEVDIRYYYWIKMVSVNGTVGPAIGPRSAIKNPTVDYIIDELTGKLNNSHLNDALNASIDSISDISSGLSDLKQDQIFGDTILSEMWDDLKIALDKNTNDIVTVNNKSISDDEVLLQTIHTMSAELGDSNAEYGKMIEVLAANDKAQSKSIEIHHASLSLTNETTGDIIDVTATFNSETAASVARDNAAVARIETLEARTDPDNDDGEYAKLQQQMIVTTATADRAEGKADTAQKGANSANTAAGLAQSDATKALGDASDAFTKASGAETKANTAQGTANTAQGEVDSLEKYTYALYTLTTDVNGLVSGFGLINDGVTSSFIVHADYFAVGIPNRGLEKDNVYPFIIGPVDGKNVIALNGATMITDAAITTAKIADANITTAKIRDAAVDTLKIGGDAVTVPAGESGYVSVQVGNAWTFLDQEANVIAYWPGDNNANGPGNYPAKMVISAQVSFSGNNGPEGGGFDGWDDWDPNYPFPFPFMSPEEEEDPDAVPLVAYPAGPGTIGVALTIEWRNNNNGPGEWWVLNQADSDSTRSWSSVNEGYGGCVVSNTFITVPWWSRGMRCRIRALNRPASGIPSYKQTREATRYGYFVVGSKR